MAFLTKYTFSKLCKKVRINREIDVNFFVEHVYNDPQIHYILNKSEVRYLFKYRAILEDEDNFYTEYYQEVPERVDTGSYVFEQAGKLKYHLNDNCQFIKKDFIDFNIPLEIRTLGKKAIDEFRNWFKDKNFAEQYYNNTLDNSVVVFNYNLKFPKKYSIPPLNEKYELVKKLSNSNSSESEIKFDMKEFQKNLIYLKEKYYNIFSCEVSRTLSKFHYLLRKPDGEIKEKMSEVFSKEFTDNYGMKNIKDKLEFSRNLKTEIIIQLLDYFKWSYKLDEKKFNNVTLEKFGLDCCSNCKKQF